jgi:uncharacterized protein YecT (DUF1311 family)
MRAAIYFLIITFAVSAWAEETQTEGYGDCIDKFAPINNAAVYSCSGNEKRAALAKIEQLLNKLENSLDEVHFNHLANSQVAWEQYVEQQCKLQGYYIGSPMHSVCPMNKALDRVDDLEFLLQAGYFPNAKN